MATADPNALDDFLNAFRTQVDSGFGLISADVHAVFATLIVVSVGFSALMWTLDETGNLPAELVRKIILVGFFAWVTDAWPTLSRTIIEGFAALGLKAGAGGLALEDFLGSPSRVVGSGFRDVMAIMRYVGSLSQEGYGVGFFAHFDVILIAAVCAVGLLLAFVILAAEIAVTVIEFHLVTLVAFVTLPFGVLARTAFLAERALGYVVSAGLKLMTLALVVSIGEGVFDGYVVSPQPAAAEVLGLLLSAVLMLALALKAPPIAAALAAGGPSLTAGATAAGLAGLVGGAAGAASARISDLAGLGERVFGERGEGVDAALAAAGLSDSEGASGRAAGPTPAPAAAEADPT